MSYTKKKRTVSIRITVLGVFLVVVALTAGLSLYLQYYFSRDLAQTAAENSFLSTSEKVGERIQALDKQSADLVGVLGYLNELDQYPDAGGQQRVLSLLSGMMEQNPSFYSMYVGYETGNFFEIINLESHDNVRRVFAAAPNDRWVLIKITEVDGARRKETSYLDQRFHPRIRTQASSDYDPRQRPWFSAARKSPGIIKTAPYFFSLLKAPGVTFAKSMNGGHHVVAVDISLAGMSSFLQKQNVLPNSQALIFDAEGNVIASTTHIEADEQKNATNSIPLTDEETSFLAATPVIRASNEIDWPPFDFTMSGQPRGYSVDMLNLLADKAGLRVEYINGFSWNELVDLFKQGDIDLLHSLMRNSQREAMGVFTKPYISTQQVFVVKKDSPFPASLQALAGKTIAIPEGWNTDLFLKKNYPGIRRLHVASTLEALRAVADGRADATLDIEPVLRFLISSYFLQTVKIGGNIPELAKSGPQGLHFLVRPDKKILAGILDKALAAVTPQEHARLEAKWFGTGTTPSESPEKNATLSRSELEKLAKTAGAQRGQRIMMIKGEPYFSSISRIKSVYGSNEFLGLFVPVRETMRPYMEKVRFSLLVTLGLLLLLAPVVWYCATIIVKPINALVLESDKVKMRHYDEVQVVDSNITEIHGLSRSMVSMASSIKSYEKSLSGLMDSFIQLIATAIDQKSPYTGGHCARVPELAIMLAHAASESTAEALAGFTFNNEDEWHEFRTAAWLHDCGKVTTPEYIVDKATKLETIYNRIHEVRTRFEVLLRDAEIEYWREVAQGGDAATLAQSLENRKQQICDDFAFLAQCNVGGEFMGEDEIARVREIATQTWIRHLDDRIGLGPLEILRYGKDKPDLPCEEPLLADRPEHVIRRPHAKPDNGRDFGFLMDEPEYLYNLGEVYNLSISRGTLTPEDRYKINEHITTTIRMLETLPYPKNMTRIPEYAGTHHETLIGTGYPRKLTAKDIGIPGRIMAIADVFEALTASDRPYKKAKTLSESVHILSRMVSDKHLDADLFALFLESGVYLDYAHKFLAPAQVDEVDVVGVLDQIRRQQPA